MLAYGLHDVDAFLAEVAAFLKRLEALGPPAPPGRPARPAQAASQPVQTEEGV
jgi:hypothetical protein